MHAIIFLFFLVQFGWTKAGRTPKYREFVAIFGNVVILFRCFREENNLPRLEKCVLTICLNALHQSVRNSLKFLDGAFSQDNT